MRAKGAPVLESQRVEVSGEPQPYGLCDVGYQGLEHDKEFGLINNDARYLHPRIGGVDFGKGDHRPVGREGGPRYVRPESVVPVRDDATALRNGDQGPHAEDRPVPSGNSHAPLLALRDCCQNTASDRAATRMTSAE